MVAPMDGRLFVVGDVHGCVAELDVLLAALELGAGDAVVCLGDYVDRGPSARDVVDRLLELQRRSDVHAVFLRGNHEDMLLGYLGLEGRHGDAFLANGGGATARSYGLRGVITPAHLRQAMPVEHLRFLERTQLAHVWGDYVMVHAGIRPGVPLARQTPEDLMWIRHEFIVGPHDLGSTVVFGHTPTRDPIVDLPFKIGIDTGCVYGGCLTALELPARRLHQVARAGHAVRQSPLQA